MTPERKKKLRQVFPIIHRPPHLVPHPNPNSFQLLLREAAKQLKIEQEKKEAERRKVLKIPNKNSHKHDHFAIMTIFRWLERELDPAGTLKELPTNSWGRSAISITSQCLEIFILFFITRPPLLPCLFFSYILNEFRRIVSLESEKFDLERDVQVMIVSQNNHQL